MGAIPGAGPSLSLFRCGYPDMTRLETRAELNLRAMPVVPPSQPTHCPPPRGGVGPLLCLFFPEPFSLGHPPGGWSVCSWVWQPQGLLRGPLLPHPVTTLLLCVSPSSFSFTSLWLRFKLYTWPFPTCFVSRGRVLGWGCVWWERGPLPPPGPGATLSQQLTR